MDENHIVILSGGTISHVTPHLALCAPSYGKIGRDIELHLRRDKDLRPYLVNLYESKMAGGIDFDTVESLSELLDKRLDDPLTKCIVIPAAVCDFKAKFIQDADDSGQFYPIGKDKPRLKSKTGYKIDIEPYDKLIKRIKDRRPDILLVSFKTTTGLNLIELQRAAEKALEASNSNIVFANDIENRLNTVYHKYYNDGGFNRVKATKILCKKIKDHLMK